MVMDTIKHIVMFAGIGVLVVSCGNGKGAQEPSSSKFTTDSLNWVDSISTGSASSVVSIDIVYPSSQGIATDSINGWISERMGAAGFKIDNGNLQKSMGDLAAKVGTAAVDSIKKDYASYAAEGFEDFASEQMSWNIRPLYVSDGFVTYQYNYYGYYGGAHGTTTTIPASFTFPAGKLIGYNMFNPDDLGAVRSLVLDGLMKQYFKVPNDSALAERLVISIEDVTLPQQPPYIVKDGVGFIYQQYEIAPYSEGMPMCVIPFSEISKYMTPEMQKTVKQK